MSIDYFDWIMNTEYVWVLKIDRIQILNKTIQSLLFKYSNSSNNSDQHCSVCSATSQTLDQSESVVWNDWPISCFFSPSSHYSEWWMDNWISIWSHYLRRNLSRRKNLFIQPLKFFFFVANKSYFWQSKTNEDQFFKRNRIQSLLVMS